MMITPGQLFKIRLQQETKRKLKAWGSVLDWTVWLYLLIPGVIIGGGLYRELWMDMPEWALMVPWTAVYPVVLFILILLLGQVQVPVEDADKLLLLQRAHWLQALKARAMVYMAVKVAILLVIPFAVLLPFLLRVEELGLPDIGLAYGFTAIMCIVIGYGGLGRQGKLRGWKKWTVEILVAVLFALAYLIPMIGWADNAGALAWSMLASLLILAVLGAAALRAPLRFEEAVKEANAARHRSTEMLMSQAMERQPLIRWKRPYIFRRSQRVFSKYDDAGTMLAELRLKAFIRAMTHLRVWLSFISITSYAITLVPLPVALILLLSLPMVGNSWLQLQWRQWFTEEFIAQYRWAESDVKRGIWLSRFWLLLPPIVIWSSLAGFKLGGIWVAIPAAGMGAIVWRMIKR